MNQVTIEQLKRLKAFSFLNDKLRDASSTSISEIIEGVPSLVLGAGVSGCLIGSWTELLNELAIIRCCDPSLQHRGIDEQVIRDFLVDTKSKRNKPVLPPSVNYLEQGEYLMYNENDIVEGYDPGQEIYWREVFFSRMVLYAMNLLRARKTSGLNLADYFLAHYKEAAFVTLSAIVRLCVRKRFYKIIVYNFDTIIEELLASEKVWKRFGERTQKDRFKRIEIYGLDGRVEIPGITDLYRESEEAIRFYHVHGVLHSKIKDIQPIIFSENSYQDYQLLPLNQGNVLLADAVYHSNVLTVGFSGNDPNFRALGHALANKQRLSTFQARNEEEGYRIYLSKALTEVLSCYLPYDKDKRKYTLEKEKAAAAGACTNMLITSMELYYKHQIGTEVLWVADHEAFAEELKGSC